VGGERWEKYTSRGLTPPLGMRIKFALFNCTIIQILRKTLGLERANFFPTAGAAVSPDVERFVHAAGLNIKVGYGLTESTATVSCDRDDQVVTMGSVGRLVDKLEIKFGENNEVLLRGKTITPGYYKKEEETRAAIDEEGWFHTGDIGEIDKQGFIKITGRIKNMIVLGGGKKIFPEEVEAVLETSNLIKELCVMSLTIKSGNKAGTEEVGVIICPSDELQKKTDEEIQKELENEVKKLSEANLASYKTPTVIVLHRDELPKTSTRKVKRKDLKEWYESL
jgi:long-subunit acyl-CoA synthetase (AMP-forming)